ncbi:hypothetical protein O7627_15440 [Solwaraspora sp. WMMD1047]|uniref:hypothetical protein n=1 Tax=Solwaraspora sp. WMMD1047 TaxID=3016102 RepID=UPI002417258F|nr:hypothetical protein [Solwaraspora sp. WMMD1047]MDG4830687.1 hypothetical protein [Solwaraspora sp. WMMD1047]
MGDRTARAAGVAHRFRVAYGAPLWHLPLLAGCCTVAGWVALRLAGEATAGRMLGWFVAAVVVHDLVVFPIYAAADRALLAAASRIGRPAAGAVRLAAVNHIRVPALGSALLLLVYLPGILRLGGDTFTAATGLTQQPYLVRWLLITAAMFAVSGLWFAARLRRVRSPVRRPPPDRR